MVSTSYQVVAVMCIFSGVSVAGWNSLNIITTELYSTRIRSTAFGLFSGVGRIGAILGNLVFGQFEDVNQSIPLVLSSIALWSACIATLFLPETKNRPIV